ncbi:class I SAM-dependent methyltransferase [Patescibacteria group bacterium]|nr:class I SAM-dependent methyltransferase [Patescibacteria group bacterium]
MIKNRKINKTRTFDRISERFGLKNKKVFDIGCGKGEFLPFFGEGSVGITTNQSEVSFGKENNLNIIFGNAELIDDIEIRENFDVIWANNLFEHILSPHSFLIKLKQISNKDTVLILGVPVIPKLNFLLRLSKFRGCLASNHINFFTGNSLKLTVERAGWKIKEVRSFVFGIKLLDNIFTLFFSPHIYIVANNISDFKYHEKKLAEWEGDDLYNHLIKITEAN